MSQELGYPKQVEKLKDTRFDTYTDKQLPYGDIYRGAWKGTLEAAAGHWWKVPSPVSGHVPASGRQLKILFMRFVGEDASGCQFAIVQTGAPAAAVTKGLSNGTIDYPYLEGAGAELETGSLEAPLHLIEGTVDFYINGATALTTEYAISWWGCEAPPTIQS